MSWSWPVPDKQRIAFELAVAERLGIDPKTAILEHWTVDPDVGGVVTLKHVLDPDELLEMFNTGKCRPSPAEPAQPEPGRLKDHVLTNLELRAKSALQDGANESASTRLPARMLLSLIQEVHWLRENRAQWKKTAMRMAYNGDPPAEDYPAKHRADHFHEGGVL